VLGVMILRIRGGTFFRLNGVAVTKAKGEGSGMIVLGILL
jgi:hypothetical protein